MWITVTSGTGVIVLNPFLTFSRHTGRYLSNRSVRLALSDCAVLVSTQLVTMLREGWAGLQASAWGRRPGPLPPQLPQPPLPAPSPGSRVPAQVGGVDVEDSRAGHGGRRGGPQVADLKEEPHGGVEGNALVAGQGEDLGKQLVTGDA